MNIGIAGGTGLLGSAAAKIMIEQGHNVHAFTLPFVKGTLDIPEKMILHIGDYNTLSDDELDQFMTGLDAFVFAAGIDERIEFNPPVYEAYMKYNIQPVIRLLSSAKRMGVKKAVVLGSYFAYFAKKWPKLKLEENHPYIKSRLEQEKVAFSFADSAFEVVVIELPYIFGAQKGRKPVWSIFIERFDKPKVIFFPKGGTTMVTVHQVGVAIYHAILYGKNKTAYPLGYFNMTWKKLIKLVLYSMGKHKPVITIPNFLAHLGIKSMQKTYNEKGIEPGLNPRYFAKLMTAKTYIDRSLSSDLLLPDDDIIFAIHESISYAYEIYQKNLSVNEMKATL